MATIGTYVYTNNHKHSVSRVTQHSTAESPPETKTAKLWKWTTPNQKISFFETKLTEIPILDRQIFLLENLQRLT